jgi:hypothetical protein
VTVEIAVSLHLAVTARIRTKVTEVEFEKVVEKCELVRVAEN